MNQTQDDDGNWVPAEPLPPQGVVAKMEFWMRKRGWKHIPSLLAAWDERRLGK